ncbi:MAG: hypothetical protein QM831_37100 [Kofleriaceae bacterium]
MQRPVLLVAIALHDADRQLLQKPAGPGEDHLERFVNRDLRLHVAIEALIRFFELHGFDEAHVPLDVFDHVGHVGERSEDLRRELGVRAQHLLVARILRQLASDRDQLAMWIALARQVVRKRQIRILRRRIDEDIGREALRQLIRWHRRRWRGWHSCRWRWLGLRRGNRRPPVVQLHEQRLHLIFELRRIEVLLDHLHERDEMIVAHRTDLVDHLLDEHQLLPLRRIASQDRRDVRHSIAPAVHASPRGLPS